MRPRRPGRLRPRQLRPYLRDEDVRIFGTRDAFVDDGDVAELRGLKVPVTTVSDLRGSDPAGLGAATAGNLGRRPSTASGSTWTPTSSTPR